MVQIISKGQIPEERVYQSTCPRCKTVFRFQQFEANYNRCQTEGDFLTISCPLCDDKVTQPANKPYVEPPLSGFPGSDH